MLATLVLVDTIHTPEALTLLDRLQTPVWIVDLDRGAQWWCNLACLPVFHADSRAALIERSGRTTPSEASRTRLDALRRSYARGDTSIDRWTLYPEGAEPFVAECRSSGIWIADRPGDPARLAMLIEARVLGADEIDPRERRGVEALRYLGELVSLYTPTGEALMRNPAAIRALGDPGPGDQLAASLVDPQHAPALRDALTREPSVRADLQLRTSTGERWYDSELRRSLDPVTGQLAILVTHRDISERRAQQAELEAQRARLATQAELLLRLAAPVLRIASDALVLPLIGALDRDRVDVALSALLTRITSGTIRRVVLDLTGVAEFDDIGAAALLRVVQVLALQGVRATFSGIGPALAQAIVRHDADLGGVACHPTLAEALRAR